MSDGMIILLVVLAIMWVNVYLLWRELAELKQRHEADQRYLEWWMWSMEECKADKHAEEALEDET